MPSSFHIKKSSALKEANRLVNQGYYRAVIMSCRNRKDKRIKYQVETKGRKMRYAWGKKKGSPIVGKVVDETR